MKTPMRPLALILALSFIASLAAGQSTEAVLYSFGASGADGIFPEGDLLFDAVGNVYGTTSMGGSNCIDVGGCGTVYKLSPSLSGQWKETILYNFCSTGHSTNCPDGSNPFAGLVMDANGNLYGTTQVGGNAGGGVVYRLSPPSTKGAKWSETVLWNFSSAPDNGNAPGYGKLAMDAFGNLYGTTVGGGSNTFGTVYELTPQSDGTYAFSLLHSFSGLDGAEPVYGVTIDGSGNLYGTTSQGGKGKSVCEFGCGLVYRLSASGSAWSETVLYEFDGSVGAYPISPISIDRSGNLYGTFESGGRGDCVIGNGSCGGVFKLITGTNHKYALYYNNNGGVDGGNPQSGVATGADNTVYGTVGVSIGSVYMLQNSVETVLYNFCSLPNCSDGSEPSPGNIVLRGAVLYGATHAGGDFGGGVIYRIQK